MLPSSAPPPPTEWPLTTLHCHAFFAEEAASLRQQQDAAEEARRKAELDEEEKAVQREISAVGAMSRLLMEPGRGTVLHLAALLA